MKKFKLLYLQLPLLDNDPSGERENFLFGATYLDYALESSDESDFFDRKFAPASWDDLDNSNLIEKILAEQIDVLSCTVYLWNIERTLRIAKILKKLKPNLYITVGGPEVAKEHPLLFAEPIFDSVTLGEGEGVFAKILKSWREEKFCDYENVAELIDGKYRWGEKPAPFVDLTAAQPPAELLMKCVENRPVVYVETVRGCPLSCAYCRYFQLHTKIRVLEINKVLERITQFQKLGANEIRFVDPTFNARKDFTELLKSLVELNADKKLAFFAELRADKITDEQAILMAKANFKDVEVGVQSIDPVVLKNVNRPNLVDKLSDGISRLIDAGVHVTLDVMYGLPEQTIDDVKNSLDWCLDFGEKVQVQCMQTLILPGTILRERTEMWGIKCGKLPPYGISETSSISPEDIQEIEILLDENPDLPSPPVTPRFCGERLSGMFKEQIKVSVNDAEIGGKKNRRCVIISGKNLFDNCEKIESLIASAISKEPDCLWQFVLEPEAEEPLDLLINLAETICAQESHMIDRFASATAFNLLFSRRLFVRIKNPLNFSKEWRIEAENLLREFFG